MFSKVLNLKQSFNSHLAIGLVLCALAIPGNAMAINSLSTQGQDPSSVTDQRKDEGEAIQPNGDNQNELDVDDAGKVVKTITGGDYHSMSEKQMRKDSLKLALQPFSFKSGVAGEGQSLYNIARESAAQLDKQFYIKQAKENERAGDSKAASIKNNRTSYYDPSAGQQSTVSRSFHFNF